MMMSDLPALHAVRGRWMPLKFFPLIGAADCITVAIVAVDSAGRSLVLQANSMHKLECLFGSAARDHIQFINMAIDCLRDEVAKHGADIFENQIDLGSAFTFGPSSAGSGNDLDEIAQAWLEKVSILHQSSGTDLALLDVVRGEVAVASLADVSEPAQVREKKIVPAVRDEVAVIAPRFVHNFNREFIFKDRRVPVKLNYNGDHLVAGFDRVSPRNIGGSLEKVRSKLWVLAEHRDQTRHEAPKLHEMLVVPSSVQDRIIDTTEIKSITEACGDIEKEADRREIRFRLFQNTREIAAHIYRVESGPSVSLARQ